MLCVLTTLVSAHKLLYIVLEDYPLQVVNYLLPHLRLVKLYNNQINIILTLHQSLYLLRQLLLDSNQRPLGYGPNTLPLRQGATSSYKPTQTPTEGLEPSTSRLEVGCSIQLSQVGRRRQRDLNPRVQCTTDFKSVSLTTRTYRQNLFISSGSLTRN